MIPKNFLDDVTSSTKFKPNKIELLMYLFFERGISYEQFKKLPVPYILSMVQTHAYFKDLEKQEYEKAKRKRR